MYTKEFAVIYNKYWASFSENLANKYLQLVKSKKSLLDLGCGTGNFLQKMEDKFDKCVGVDLSSAMIDIAKNNCKKTVFYVQDITKFSFNEKFNLITCNFDMINHLINLEDWAKVFSKVYNHLTDDGVFVFDYNTISKFNKFNNTSGVLEKDECTINVENIKTDNNHMKMKFSIFDKVNNQTTEFEETESFFDDVDVIKALTSAGFSNFKIVDKEFNKVDNYNYDRLYVICKKSEN